MKKQKIIVILGETATGKSDLAVKIARKINGEIISADSRQVYKGLDIGTGKITQKEMQGIPHYMIDVANSKKKFTVAEYQKLTNRAIVKIVNKGKVPIICGGTGFYIDAITKGTIFPEVPPNPKLRKILYSKSAIANFEYLKKLDPRRAKSIKDKNEINNKVRLVRAIEIAKTLGKVTKLQSDTNFARAENMSSYKFIKIGLFLPPDILKKKIEKRVKKMFNKKNRGGLLNEIKKLKKSGISNKRLQEFGFEYDSPTYEKVVSGTIKYAKRQRLWFKKDKEIKWFDISKNKSEKSLLAKVQKDF